MAFVTDADVQEHLPIDKLQVERIPDDKAQIYLGAERVVRGYLSGVVDSAVLATWTDPTSTPGVIRQVCALFAASEIYRVRTSEASTEYAAYAQRLYDEAMALLNNIISGALPIDGVAVVQIDSTWFEPNDSTAPPRFTMDGRY